MKALADALSVDASDIVDFDLNLADCQLSAIGGVYDEFIFAPRLDNLLCSYTSLMVIILYIL